MSAEMVSHRSRLTDDVRIDPSEWVHPDVAVG